MTLTIRLARVAVLCVCACAAPAPDASASWAGTYDCTVEEEAWECASQTPWPQRTFEGEQTLVIEDSALETFVADVCKFPMRVHSPTYAELLETDCHTTARGDRVSIQAVGGSFRVDNDGWMHATWSLRITSETGACGTDTVTFACWKR
jgi:hypothetical protein